tara:strand:- start:21137 stop:21328 length:192 start_codon:yes stop_codon:yes gene_type:complete
MKEIIASLATELGDPRVTPEAIRKWEERGRIPHRLRLPLIELAKTRRLKLSASDFDFPPRKAA